jgi:RNA polymerase sigma-70 factor (ECF subfamily)
LAFSQAEFDRMVGDHGPALYRMAYRLIGDRHEAEDVVQDTFRSAWKSRASFRAGCGARAWLTAILRRRAVDHWRRPARPSLTDDGLAPEVGRLDAEPGRDECSDQMQRGLDQLPDELREALLLVVVGELTHHEAAELLGIPLGTVLSRVSRARRRLRDYLLAKQP